MDETSETNATATDETGSQPPSATDETLVLSVADTAELLGISPQAVRKRIKTGTLDARKEGRKWIVFLQRAIDETRETATTKPPTKPRSETSQPLPQPSTRIQEMAAYQAEIEKPLLDRIDAIHREYRDELAQRDREAGRLEQRAETAELKRDALSDELKSLRSRLANLDVWERDVEPVNYPSIRETEPGGPDTRDRAGESDQKPPESTEDAPAVAHEAEMPETGSSESFWSQLWRHLKGPG